MSAGLRKALGVLIAAAGALVAVYLIASWYIVDQSLVAEASPIEQTPADMGAAYEEVSFAPRGWDGVTLRGWWLDADVGAPTILWLHGLDTNRAARIDVVTGLRAAGFNVLAFDFRGHGESDKVAMGAGIHEQDDVLGALDWLAAEQGVSIDEVGMLGLSYGGAIALLTAADEPRLRAVFADSAYASLTELMSVEITDRTGAPPLAVALLRPGILLAARFSRGLDLDAGAPEDAAAAIDRPIALIHCRDDDRVPYEHSERIRDAAPPGSTLAIVEECAHARASDEEGAAYVQRAAAYFRARLAQ